MRLTIVSFNGVVGRTSTAVHLAATNFPRSFRR